MKNNELKKILKILLFILVAVFILSFFKKDSLPYKDEILNESYREPIQAEIIKEPFVIEKNGISYNVEPKYSYKISGLIVEEYDSENWLDVFHKEDFLNTRDLCLLWGDNVKTNVFHNYKYTHGEFTCFLKSKNVSDENNAETGSFSWSQISNSHLLPANPEIYQKIKNAEIGDQIFMSGYLVDYSYDLGEGPWRRTSSINREDTGNGACEIIYVTDFKITKESNRFYHMTFIISLLGIIICLILLFILALRNPRPPKPPRQSMIKFSSILPDKITTKY